jgi:hypothetical protein
MALQITLIYHGGSTANMIKQRAVRRLCPARYSTFPEKISRKKTAGKRNFQPIMAFFALFRSKGERQQARAE